MTSTESRKTRIAVWTALGVGGVVALVVLFRSTAWGGKSDEAVSAAGVPRIAVAAVDTRDLYREVRIPAEFRAYYEVDLHAKVSGYVRRMDVEIGDQVHKGQVLAELEVPELQDELEHADAAFKRAEAEYRSTHLQYDRLVAVNRERPNLLAQQDLDSAEASDASSAGALAAAKAEASKYRALVGYTRITAPFDGVIARRYADPGALIQAGTSSNTQAMPLVRLADNRRLRLDFPISIEYVPSVRKDIPITLQVDAIHRSVAGKIDRFAGAVEQNTRTMLVETEVDNKDGTLLPGMYATVVLKVDERPHALAVPVEAVRSGKSVFVVDGNHRIEERVVRLGLETPTHYEVLDGLKAGELVAVGNVSQLRAGQAVDPAITPVVAHE